MIQSRENGQKPQNPYFLAISVQKMFENSRNLPKRVKMVHILPSNHERITSWRFDPNPITFEQVISVNSFLSYLPENDQVSEGYNGKNEKKCFCCFYFFL